MITHVKATFVMSDILTIEIWVYDLEYVICGHIISNDISITSVVLMHEWRSTIKKNTYRFCAVHNQRWVFYRHPRVNWSWIFSYDSMIYMHNLQTRENRLDLKVYIFHGKLQLLNNYGVDDFMSELVARCECYFIQYEKWLSSFDDDNRTNSSPLKQNGRHFADDVFKCIFMIEKWCILIQISLNFVPKGLTDNKRALI